MLTLISQYYSLLFPGQVAGEAVKAYKLGRGKQNAEQIAASVIIDKAIGLLGVISVAIGGACLSETNLAKDMLTLFFIAIIFLLTALYLFQFDGFYNVVRKFFIFYKKNIFTKGKIVDQCLRLIEAWRQYLNEPVLLLKSLPLGILYQLIGAYISLILGKSIGIDIAFADWCWIFGVISLVVVLPVTIGGIGLREGGFIFLLGNFDVSNEKALALSLSIFGFQIVGALIGAVLDFSMDLT
jgi:hypothetical protein